MCRHRQDKQLRFVKPELVSQTDAKNQTSTFSYDKLGRMTQRVEPDMTSVWTYDTAAHGIGKVATAGITAGPSAGYQRSFGYDTLGRAIQATVTVSSTNYTFAATYDGNSRLGSVTYARARRKPDLRAESAS